MDKLNKIFHILKELGIKKFYLIIFLMTLATIFEFLGISLIVPFLAILTEQNSNILNIFPENFSIYYKSLPKEKIFIGGIIIFFIIYLFKSIYLLFFNLKLNQFVFSSEASLCNLLPNTLSQFLSILFLSSGLRLLPLLISYLLKVYLFTKF